MKKGILLVIFCTSTLFATYPAWEYSPVDEFIYKTVTDCNGYYPLTRGHGQSCD